MNFLAQDPLRRAEEEMNVQPNYIRGGQAVQQGPSMTDTIVDMIAPKVMESAMTAGANALATPTATAALGKAMGGTAVTGGMGAAMGAMGGPIGMAAMLALPYLFKDGTTGVPEMDYGPDPLQGYMNGTNYVGYNQGTNMAYAGGTDSVPAMLTPGEAVIPAAAAQNPQNKPAINAMVAEGRQANSVANGTAFLNDGTQEVSESMPQEPMMGPLSGKSQREERKSQMEEMKNLQEMSLKKKAWEAEEARKQKAFEQKYAHNDMKAMLSMRQS
jgi:hypothetical protein